MEDVSHLKLMTMGFLQTCSYISEQMRGSVKIDVNKFLDAFSIETEKGHIHPPSWIPNGSGSVAVTPSVPIAPHLPPGSEAASSEPFTMDQYRKCRQAEALRWINLQEKRASIIARLQPVLPEEYQAQREFVTSESGPFRRMDKKQSGMAYSLSIIKI